MQLDRDIGHNNIEVRALICLSVGHVVRNTLGDIVHRIRVVGLRYIVYRRHRLLGMWGRVFLVFMQLWSTNRHSTRHLSLRWTISFVIKLFLLLLTLDLIIAMLFLTWWISMV